MIDLIKQIDQFLFYFINRDLANPVFDYVFPLITDLHNNKVFTQYLLIPLLLIWLFFGRAKAFKAILCIAISAGICDLANHRFLKEVFERERPNITEQVDSILRLPHSPKSYSFPSNHAVNNFSAATVIAAFYPAAAVYVGLWAGLIAFSRVYVGVHFPSDVYMGAILGILVGFVLVLIFRRIPWLGSDLKK